METILNLSKREQEVVNLVKQGLSNREISEKLFVAEVTVKVHLTKVFKKLNVKNRKQLIVKTLTSGE